MVVRMIKWRPPWQQPSLCSEKFQTKITVHHLRGLPQPNEDSQKSFYSVGIKWKGSSKGIRIGFLFQRTVRRNFTKEELLNDDGIVDWEEHFCSLCNFSAYKEGAFHPWEVSFTVFAASKQGAADIVPVIGTASLNLAEFASESDKHSQEIDIPLSILDDPPIGSSTPILHLSIDLVKWRNPDGPSGTTPKPPVLSFPRSPCYGEVLSTEKSENIPARKTSPRGVNVNNILKGLYSLRAKRPSHDEGSDGRNISDTDFNSTLDTDSSDGSYEAAVLEEPNEQNPSVGKSLSYETLAYANHVGGAAGYTNTSGSSEDDDFVYFSHRRSDASPISVLDCPVSSNPKRGLLPWRKRKLGFSSRKGEPLLKKYYGEEGGDDIDHDRRQLSFSDRNANDEAYVGEFDEDSFTVGEWEQKEITSRDGVTKLKTQVFLASIDQRSERAAGEGACTALVALVAHWLHSNPGVMPVKSQFDALIRDGSLEWRNLCEDEVYAGKFPDKHFDLETILEEARVRPVSLVPEKSFVGFFEPDGLDFLEGAMTFDGIWDEISGRASEMCARSEALVYIVSWNDHFFVVKVEWDRYYVIETLGERLEEGGRQAFILKFDKDTTMMTTTTIEEDDEAPAMEENEIENDKDEKRVIPIARRRTSSVKGKETCREYMKKFMAAIPIREVQEDILKKKREREREREMELEMPLLLSQLHHRRLQIEFHYTQTNTIP
ncbi:uncharacterized protein LOC127260019 [Andrographis paniculata]|uniref:uncharacterized protein LOC127260019 n=1 Tax=Andrographis paniculata TaxID=175694 RepID=UPI0021E71FAA|nr:uncharacterized protein LOC127260019 [Andrographis paniculata]